MRQSLRRQVGPVAAGVFDVLAHRDIGDGGGVAMTTKILAAECGVSAKTVANWCKQGLLRCDVLESGHRRIPESALDAYRASQARWQQLDAVTRSAPGAASEVDEATIVAAIAERRRG